MDIPKALLDQIKIGNTVLFLGAGATYGASHKNNHIVPNGKQLAELIAKKFVDDDLSTSSLQIIAEIAISDTDLFTLQNFIAEYFRDFEPAEHHLKVPSFRWKAIITTNYDLIVEKSFSKNPNPQQILVKFIKDEKISDRIQTINDLQFLKLHGCVTEINNPEVPLILTIDQYVSHKSNRERLFSRVQDLMRQYTFIYIGHSLEDSDIREILLSQPDNLNHRLRSYIVAPTSHPSLKRMFEQKKITTLDGTYEDFINTIYEKIDLKEIHSPLEINDVETESEILKIISKDQTPSENLINFLKVDIVFPKTTEEFEEISPEYFFKGNSNSFFSIKNEFDVRRNLENGFISEVFLDSNINGSKIYQVLGHAGSGKTIFLQRLAFEAVNTYNKICLYFTQTGIINIDAIIELSNIVRQRIFLIIDKTNQHEIEILNLYDRLKKEGIDVTIVTAERTNIWNVECQRIKPFLNHNYYLKYLTSSEIDDLINLLEIHDCLGYLKDKPRDIQRIEFEERAGRDLLVALYEATQGKSFQEIVTDEYHSIPDERAKEMYLTVCLMHSLGSFTRAGLLSRIHGVSFSEFEDLFFLPLENLIYSRRDYYINDNVYETRHRLIAEFVVSSILSNEQIKYDEYIKIISEIDIDYDSDMNAFFYITNAKKLLKNFRDPSKIRRLYKVAHKKSFNDAKLHQQEAIFEMESSDGSLVTAEKLLYIADQLTNGKDSIIRHSLSELLLAKANNSSTNLEKKKLLFEVIDISNGLIKKRNQSAHPFHTAIKARLNLLNEYIENGDDRAFEKETKETEALLNKAIQQFPEETHIIEAQSNFNELLNNKPEAISLLERAFQINKSSPYLSIRLANIYDSNGDIVKAKGIIYETLQNIPGDRDLNFSYSKLLSKEDETNNILEIKHYLKRSFSPKDNRYNAQFWYARILYINNEIPESHNYFEFLSKAQTDPKLKYNIRGVIKYNAENLALFSGEIFSVHSNYGFIKRDSTSDTIFFSFHNRINDIEEMEYSYKFKRGERVHFNIGFSYNGPVAINIDKEY